MIVLTKYKEIAQDTAVYCNGCNAQPGHDQGLEYRCDDTYPEGVWYCHTCGGPVQVTIVESSLSVMEGSE